MPENTTCVVGAGPAGLLLALLLGRRGHRVVVLERNTRLDGPSPGAQSPVIQPATLQMLAKLDLLDAVRAESGEIRSGDVHQNGNRVGGYAYTDIPGSPLPYSLTISVRALRRELVRAVSELPSVEIVLGATVTGLTDDGDRYALTYDVPDGARTLRPDFIVGSDGKFSTLRGLAEIPTEVFTYDKGYLDFLITAPSDWGPRLGMHFADGNYVLASPAPGGELRIAWITTEQRVDEVLAGSPDDLAKVIGTIAPALADTLAEQLNGKQWDEVGHRHVQHHMVRPDCWLRRNLVLLGDSAHGLHAFGGQGLNTGLQDAALLAVGISHAFRDGTVARLEELIGLRKPFMDAFQDVQRETLTGQRRDSPPDLPTLALGQAELRDVWSSIPEGIA
ncbi:pentachlorophenol monooxygenase [Lentzea sp. NBRC 105346]|uniref:FAD-dependent oxidoreductase n=1 Tax=Lentzea sp. NBRC 105346 TaxID=3032205 RepID=UPI0024A4BA33|nr:NAD(P)/FAD-dependent oxidoreductase [Lentzea sp. NBRC 105346]GLZ32254.1 pentachlorophenol monooxygenase [Lentzea sp. NBRC 105346]